MIEHSLNPQTIPLSQQTASPLLIVEALSQYSQISWKRAGWIRQKIFIPEIGVLNGVSRCIYLGLHTYEFPLLSSQYSLDFELVGWLRNVYLNIWQDV